MKIETIADLEAVLEKQNLAIEAVLVREARQDAVITGLGDLVRAMDLKLRTLTALIDSHQSVLIAAGLAKPRPEDPIVN